MEAILSATKTSAEACGLDKVTGTLEIGKEADLIVFDIDPLENIKILRYPEIVMKSGKIIPFSGRKEASHEREKLRKIVLKALNKL